MASSHGEYCFLYFARLSINVIDLMDVTHQLCDYLILHDVGSVLT